MAVPPRIAIVLAGAVAKGAFEAGALQALARADVEIVRIVAASSGALNGTLAAASVRAGQFPQGMNLLAELWRDDAGWRDAFHLSSTDLLARRAVSDSHRILDLLRKRIPPVPQAAQDINLRLLVAPLYGTTGTVGQHEATTFEAVRDFATEDFSTAEALERVFTAATASSAFPFLFAPVEVDDLGPCVDGGAVNNTPVKWALEGVMGASLDAIVVISTTLELRPEVPHPLHGLEYAGHLATMLVGERLYRDLKEAETVNVQLARLKALVATGVLDEAQHAQVLAALDWAGHRPVQIVQIRPLAELTGSSFTGFFDADLRRGYVDAGLARGLEVLESCGWVKASST
jgi:NTE family protein